jgi:hypothetical protein
LPPRRQEIFNNKPFGEPLCLRAFVAIFMAVLELKQFFFLTGLNV